MSAGMGPWVSASPTLAAQTAADPGRPTTRLSSPRLHIRLVRHVRVLEVLRKLHGVGVVQEPGNRVLSQDHPLPSFGGGVSAGRARVASAPHTTVTTASSPSPPPSPQHQPRALPRLRPVKEVPAGGARGSAQRESAVHDGAGARVAATSRLVREDIGGRAVDHHEAEARAPVGRGHGSG